MKKTNQKAEFHAYTKNWSNFVGGGGGAILASAEIWFQVSPRSVPPCLHPTLPSPIKNVKEKALKMGSASSHLKVS